MHSYASFAQSNTRKSLILHSVAQPPPSPWKKSQAKKHPTQTYCLCQNLQFRHTYTGIAENLSNVFKLWNRAEKKSLKQIGFAFIYRINDVINFCGV